MSIVGSYRNGNYTVEINLETGTKVRYNNFDTLDADTYENIDLCISKKCVNACDYCFVAGTQILMGDLTYKNIEDIEIGDVVIGFEEHASKGSKKRKIIKTRVLNTFVHVESDLIKVETATSNVIATPNHPFLSSGTGAGHARIFNEIQKIQEGKSLYECGFPMDDIDLNSEQYKLGYMIGSWVGDGSIKHYIDKNGHDANCCRFVTKDEEINDKVYECTKLFVDGFYRLDFNMHGKTVSSVCSHKRSSYEDIVKVQNRNLGVNNSKEYACGFLGGFCDSEGHVDNQRSIIRLCNTDKRLIDEVARCLSLIDIDYVVEFRDNSKNKTHVKDMYAARVKGRYAASKFLWYARPVCKRKSLENYVSKMFQYYPSELIKKTDISKKQYVYNFETECHTYIANNFLVHNCYEGCSENGKHADIMNLKFIEKLHPYTELAINGNEPLHPDLVPFLEKCRDLKLIPSLTVNQKTFLKHKNTLKRLCDEGLLYGLGVSVNYGYNASFARFVQRAMNFPNLVVHVINGMVTMGQLEFMGRRGLKILILGYKHIRRGDDYYIENEEKIVKNMNDLSDNLSSIIDNGWFEVVSFDNLALKQIDVKSLMSEKEWQKFYLGRDGEVSYYVDAVDKEFAKSSLSMERWDMTDDPQEMLDIVKKSIA